MQLGIKNKASEGEKERGKVVIIYIGAVRLYRVKCAVPIKSTGITNIGRHRLAVSSLAILAQVTTKHWPVESGVCIGRLAHRHHCACISQSAMEREGGHSAAHQPLCQQSDPSANGGSDLGERTQSQHFTLSRTVNFA